MGSVAIVAGGNRPVAGIDPAIILFLHDMAIHASFGIIGEIGGTLCIVEGEGT